MFRKIFLIDCSLTEAAVNVLLLFSSREYLLKPQVAETQVLKQPLIRSPRKKILLVFGAETNRVKIYVLWAVLNIN